MSDSDDYIMQAAHYLIITQLNLEKDGTPMADLTNLQQIPMNQQISLAPVFAKAAQEQNAGQMARKRLK